MGTFGHGNALSGNLNSENESFAVAAAENSGGPRPRSWTVSIALPGSILDNAQSPELRAALACQVARAAAIFCVDEVVIFREGAKRAVDDAADDLALLLSYLDTPQYLRKHLFARSEKLRMAGLLNPLNLPNHFAKDDVPRWREGAAVAVGSWSQQAPRRQQNRDEPVLTRYIDVGLPRLVEVDHQVPVGDRVTVDLAASGDGYSVPGKYLYGQVVGRSAPRELDGLYWGYDVRLADSLLEALVWPDADADKGYDLVVGTSERGTPIAGSLGAVHGLPFALPEFQHTLIVFGGVQGLEHSARCDTHLASKGIGGEEEGSRPVDDIFDFYLNTCPYQGSRTIRTEEAIPISLAGLQQFLRPRNV